MNLILGTIMHPLPDCTALRTFWQGTECYARLVAMGFSSDEASRAAVAAGDDLERALQHLLDPELAAATEPPTLPQGPVVNGTRVALQGLKSRADLNGRAGTVPVRLLAERSSDRSDVSSPSAVGIMPLMPPVQT